MSPEVPPWSERIRRFAVLECRGLSPLYEQLGLAIADDASFIEWLSSVAGPRANPPLLFAAVHYLLLEGDPNEALARFYPSIAGEGALEGDPYAAFRAFVDRERERLSELLATRTTQTNEVARSTYLLPALVLAAQKSGRSLALVEVGAAAGLNLLFDHYAYDYGGGRTAGVPDGSLPLQTELRTGDPQLAPLPSVASRSGIDLAPIRASDQEAARWLEACVWPEHTDRMQALRAALGVAAANEGVFDLVEGNALDLLPEIARSASSEALLVVWNTNVLPYFSGDERQAYGELLVQIGAERDLVWLGVEVPPFLRAAGFQGSFAGLGTGPTALPLVMTSFVGGQREDAILALTGPHGRWLDWL